MYTYIHMLHVLLRHDDDDGARTRRSTVSRVNILSILLFSLRVNKNKILILRYYIV